MTDRESRIAARMRIRGSAKLQPNTPVPKTIAYPSRSQPTWVGLFMKIPSRYCELPDFFVSRNGSVGPSQSPTTAFTQSQTGARDRTEGSFKARSRPCQAAWEPCDRMPFAPKKLIPRARNAESWVVESARYANRGGVTAATPIPSKALLRKNTPTWELRAKS